MAESLHGKKSPSLPSAPAGNHPSISRRMLLAGIAAADLVPAQSLAVDQSAAKESAQGQVPKSFLGNLAPIARSIHQERGFPMDYAHRGSWSSAEWRSRCRAEVQNRLAYWPRTVPLDMRVHSVAKRRGYEVRTISFAGSPHYRIPAYFLMPEGRGPFPGIVALHDHGGWFYHGKEKLVRMEGEGAFIRQYRDRYYEGRAYAEDLARRGFVVVVPDAFYCGERRLQYRHPPEELQKRIVGLRPGETEYLIAVNDYLREHVPTLHIWLSYCSTLWFGIVNYDDRRCVDLLASLPEVDANRIGCLGLSGGGFRSTYLAGMEPRIRASVITGWMTSLPTTLDLPSPVHQYMFEPFGLHAYLDHPDVAALSAPDCAIFVQNCARDHLFTRRGMEKAISKIQSVYADLKYPDRFSSRFYDVPHQFNVQMQQDAFQWLEKGLK